MVSFTKLPDKELMIKGTVGYAHGHEFRAIL